MENDGNHYYWDIIIAIQYSGYIPITVRNHSERIRRALLQMIVLVEVFFGFVGGYFLDYFHSVRFGTRFGFVFVVLWMVVHPQYYSL